MTRSSLIPNPQSLIPLLLALALTGCARGQSTRLQLSDLNEAVERMRQSLARSEFLNERTPRSPPAVVVINKVQNLTHDLIPEPEQWMWVARLQGALPIRELGQRNNITFQITPERWAMLRQSGFDGELSAAPRPTHVMSAAFRSAVRTVTDKDGYAKRRQDYYYLEYTIEEIDSRRTVWQDAFEFKREAKGAVID